MYTYKVVDTYFGNNVTIINAKNIQYSKILELIMITLFPKYLSTTLISIFLWYWVTFYYYYL